MLTYTMHYVDNVIASKGRVRPLLHQSWQELIATNCNKLDQQNAHTLLL